MMRGSDLRRNLLHLLVCLSAINFIHGEDFLSVQVKRGGNVELVCPISSENVYDVQNMITWFKVFNGNISASVISYGDTMISTRDNYHLNYMENSLKITAVSDYDAGVYECSIHYQTPYSFYLTVFESPVFGNISRTVEQIEGYDARLTCIAIHLRNHSIKWDYPDSFKKEFRKFSIRYEGNGEISTSTLTIFNAKPSDQGVYTCSVDNGIDIDITLTIEVAPKFGSSFRNMTVVVGMDVELECTVENLGKYTFTWYTKSGVDQPQIEAITEGHSSVVPYFAAGSFVLRIISVSQSHQMYYICEINTPSPMKQEAYLKVIDVGNVAVPYKEILIDVVEMVQLDCYYRRGDGVDVSWADNPPGNPFSADPSISVVDSYATPDLNKITLTLQNILISGQGRTFYCIYNQNHTQEVASTKLIRKRTPTTNIVTQSINANKRGIAELPCRMQTENTTEMKWFRDIDVGKKMEISSWMDRYEMSIQGDNKLVLKITNVQTKDDALYYGQLGDEVICEVKLNVKDPQEMDESAVNKFGVLESEVEAWEGDSVELKCIAGAFDFYKLHWKSGFGSLSHLKNYTIIYEADENIPQKNYSSLIIREVILINNSQQLTPSYKFICTVEPMPEDEPFNESIVYIKVLKKPYFIVQRQLTTTMLGEPSPLTCYVDFIGDFNVSWVRQIGNGSLKDNFEVIQDSAKYELTNTEDAIFHLVIKNVTQSDVGIYRCIINMWPPISTINQLQIFIPDFGQEDSYDKLVSIERNLTAYDKQIDFNLDCYVNQALIMKYGDANVMILWYEFNLYVRRETAIHSERNFASVHGYRVRWNETTSIISLIFNQVTKGHEGLYSCKIFRTGMPFVKELLEVQYVHLKVKGLPNLDTPPYNVGFYKGQSLILNCSASNLGENDWIQWAKLEGALGSTYYRSLNNRDNTNGNYYVFFKNGTSFLAIKSTSEVDQGVYWCKIFGQTDKTLIHVEMKEFPKIYALREFVYYKPGDSVEFACRYSMPNNEDFEIHWTKRIAESELQLLSGHIDVDIEEDYTLKFSKLIINNMQENSNTIYCCSLRLAHSREFKFPVRDCMVAKKTMPPPEVILTGLYHYEQSGRTLLKVKFELRYLFDGNLEFVEYFVITLKQIGQQTHSYNVDKSSLDPLGNDYTHYMDVTEYNNTDIMYINIVAITNEKNPKHLLDKFRSFIIEGTVDPEIQVEIQIPMP